MNTLIYENINDDFGHGKYGDYRILVMRKNGYINITKLVAYASNKQGNPKTYSPWRQCKAASELIIEVTNETGLSEAELIIEPNVGNDFRGTYVHEDLSPSIASWASPKFALMVNRVINKYYKSENRQELARLQREIDIKDGKILSLEQKLEQVNDKFVETMNATSVIAKRFDESHQDHKKTHEKLEESHQDHKKTHEKLEESYQKLTVTNTVLHRVETRVDALVEHVVPPTKQKTLHEYFSLYKLNDPKKPNCYKMICAQSKCYKKSLTTLKTEFPHATVFVKAFQDPNSKNFRHRLKESYHKPKKLGDIHISNNFITLVNGTTETGLKDMINQVIEEAHEYANNLNPDDI